MFIVWDAIKIARKGTDLIPIFQGREEIVENSFRSLLAVISPPDAGSLLKQKTSRVR